MARIDGLGQVQVEAGFRRAAAGPPRGRSPSAQSDASGAGPGSRRRDRATAYPSMPPARPMSQMATSGRKRHRASSRPACPVAATATSWPCSVSGMRMLSAASGLSSTTSTRRGWLCGAASARFYARRRGLRLQRQTEGEATAAARSRALGTHVAAVQFDQALDQRQTDAQAAAATVQALVRLTERLEDARQHLSIQADPGVADGEDGHRSVGCLGQLDRDRAVGVRELDRVGQ